MYVNGILDNDYTVNNNNITFNGSTLTAGTVVTVYAFKSIDGTGIMTVSDEITALQNQYETISGASKFIYKCTGLNDNISLSQIAQAIYNGSYTASSVTAAANAFLTALGGNTYLSTLTDASQIKIDVMGVCGVSAPFAGNGTSESRYRWFSLGKDAVSEMRVIFDFAKCDKINVACSSGENVIIYGTDLNIKNINIVATGTAANTSITMVAGYTNEGKMNFEDCKFKAVSTGNARISEHGTFTNCDCYVQSSAGQAYCFKPKSIGLIRLFGGRFFAYNLTSSGISSAIAHTSTGDTDAVFMAYNIHAPIVALQNYSQGFLVVANAGNSIIDGVVSRLTSSGSYHTITNKIDKNKA